MPRLADIHTTVRGQADTPAAPASPGGSGTVDYVRT
jgi:hypothetical protein